MTERSLQTLRGAPRTSLASRRAGTRRAHAHGHVRVGCGSGAAAAALAVGHGTGRVGLDQRGAKVGAAAVAEFTHPAVAEVVLVGDLRAVVILGDVTDGVCVRDLLTGDLIEDRLLQRARCRDTEELPFTVGRLADPLDDPGVGVGSRCTTGDHESHQHEEAGKEPAEIEVDHGVLLRSLTTT